MNDRILIALAGQPNCGKSTLFNALTGARQHVANYPGVTVDKMTGWYHHDGLSFEVVDLPGCYSLTSSSPEERVSREFLLQDSPRLIVHVVDAVNLQRGLVLTQQLQEMGLSILLYINMMDMAEKRGIAIDPAALEAQLGLPVITGSMRRGIGRDALKEAINRVAQSAPKGERSRPHEGREAALARHRRAAELCRTCVTQNRLNRRTLTEYLDAILCHRLLGPLAMVAALWLLYWLAIVQGYNLTNYTWPLLAGFRNFAASLLPEPGFLDIPLLRAFVLWVIDSLNALLNYLPIFFILFASIAFLEDSGYMPRMAFIMDRLFSRYGLHGQSTLPMVLGGVYVGGCAVPAVMSCKGIPDERARLSTILIIPMLNCLAKVPLYVLLINIYFAEHKAWAMFFISTISLLLVLPISRLLVGTVLSGRPQAPFIMEMPPYHLPTFRGVFGRAVERIWMFIRKIITIVLALAVILFVLLQFPGISSDKMAVYRVQERAAVTKFQKVAKGSPWAGAAETDVMSLIRCWNSWKAARMIAGSSGSAALEAEFKAKNPLFFRLVRPEKGVAGREAKKVNRALRKLVKSRKKLLRQMRSERINNSFLGQVGRTLEPLTRWAGFNWKVNVALLSSLAAKESSVATLGALYQQSGEQEQTLEARMAAGAAGFTSLHAFALMMFMVLYPPCLATMIAVKLQSGSTKWMLFAICYPIVLGISVSSLLFTGGRLLGLDGVQMMALFYGCALLLTVLVGIFKPVSVVRVVPIKT